MNKHCCQSLITEDHTDYCLSRQNDVEQINRWANHALENLLGGWHALAEHQLRMIIEATGGFDEYAPVGGYISRAEAERIVLDMMSPPEAPGEPGS